MEQPNVEAKISPRISSRGRWIPLHELSGRATEVELEHAA